MKSFLEDYSRIIGFILLTFVVILLLSRPSMLFAHAITMIDTELSLVHNRRSNDRAIEAGLR